MQFKWLVQDHLGSTRMEIGKDGAASAVVRHDYLPFREELKNTLRVGNGYGTATKTKQKFVGYERDTETGLDFAQARYYANVQGRFTSPDPMLSSGQIGAPQTWNRYTYALNNPLRFVDPLGLYTWSASLGGSRTDEDIRKEINNLDIDQDYERIGQLQGMLTGRQAFRDALSQLEMMASTDFTLPIDQQDEITRARDAYGNEGEDNGVSIAVGGLAAGTAATTALTGYVYGSNGVPIRGKVQVTFGSLISGQNLVLNVGHEGSHVADKRAAVAAWAATGDYNQARGGALNVTGYDSERRAYYVSAYIAAHQNRESLTMGRGRDTI
jgi:RHS repeat-associated protein